MPDEDLDKEDLTDDEVEADESEEGSSSDESFDKVRQQFQQEIGNRMRPLEKQLTGIQSAMSALLTKHEDTQSTRSDIDQDEDDNLDFEDKSDEEINPYQAAKKLARHVRSMERKISDQIAGLAKSVNRAQEGADSNVEQMLASKFKIEHPELSWSDAVSRATKRIGDLVGDGEVSDDVYRKLAQREMKEVTEEMEAEHKISAKTKPDKDPAGAMLPSKKSQSKQTVNKLDRERKYVSTLVSPAAGTE